MARRLRVFCSDPDATDSSGDEECERPLRRTPLKKMMVEVFLPATSPESSSSPEGSSKRKVPSPPRRPTSASAPRGRSGIKGIRLRKWGKWAAEIRDPIRHKRVWIGTYDTAADAEMAYKREQLRFEAEKQAMASTVHAAAATTTTTFSSFSTSTTSVFDESDTPRPFRASSPSSVLDTANANATPPSKPEPSPPPLPLPLEPMTEDFSAIPFDEGPFLPQDFSLPDFGIDVSSFFADDILDNPPLLDVDVHGGGVCAYSPLENACGFDGFLLDGRDELSDLDFDPSLWINS